MQTYIYLHNRKMQSKTSIYHIKYFWGFNMITKLSRRDILKGILSVSGLSVLSDLGIMNSPVQAELARPSFGMTSGLKITGVEAFQVKIPWDINETFRFDQKKRFFGKYADFGAIKISTDSGITGFCLPWGARLKIDEKLKSLLLGADPFAIEQLVQKGLDMYPHAEHAVWDIIGKAVGLPVHKVLGFAQSKVKAYLTTVFNEPFDTIPFDTMASGLLGYKQKGFKAAKIQAHHTDPNNDVEAVRVIRDAVGYDFEIMLDRTGQFPGWTWTYDTALQTAKGLEKYQAYWLEEPFYRGEFVNSARLAAAVDIPITGGEGIHGLEPFAKYLANEAFDIIQPDAFSSGGILMTRKIGGMAQAFGKRCILHGYHSLAVSGPLQVIGSLPNCTHMELVYNVPPWTPQDMWEPGLKLIQDSEMYTFEDGYIVIPDKPGLGHRINEEALQEYRV